MLNDTTGTSPTPMPSATEEDLLGLLALLSEAQSAHPRALDRSAPVDAGPVDPVLNAHGQVSAGELKTALGRIGRLEANLRETQADRDQWRVRAQSADQYCADLRSRTQRAILLMIGLAVAALIEVIARA